MRAADTSLPIEKLTGHSHVNMEFYLKHRDGTHRNQNHYSDIHFRCQPPAVVVVVMPVILLRMIQHVVIIFTSFLVLQDEMKDIDRFRFLFSLTLL